MLKPLKDMLKGKVVMDATNPVAHDRPPKDGVLPYFTTGDLSLMETLMVVAPQAHFVKAFNTVNEKFFIDPPFEQKPTMFIAGNSADAKAVVSDIIAAVGWEPEYVGGAHVAELLEQLCRLWIARASTLRRLTMPSICSRCDVCAVLLSGYCKVLSLPRS